MGGCCQLRHSVLKVSGGRLMRNRLAGEKGSDTNGANLSCHCEPRALAVGLCLCEPRALAVGLCLCEPRALAVGLCLCEPRALAVGLCLCEPRALAVGLCLCEPRALAVGLCLCEPRALAVGLCLCEPRALAVGLCLCEPRALAVGLCLCEPRALAVGLRRILTTFSWPTASARGSKPVPFGSDTNNRNGPKGASQSICLTAFRRSTSPPFLNWTMHRLQS